MITSSIGVDVDDVNSSTSAEYLHGLCQSNAAEESALVRIDFCWIHFGSFDPTIVSVIVDGIGFNRHLIALSRTGVSTVI